MSKLKTTVTDDNSQIIVTDDNGLFIGVVNVMWSKQLNRFYLDSTLDAHDFCIEEIDRLIESVTPKQPRTVV